MKSAGTCRTDMNAIQPVAGFAKQAGRFYWPDGSPAYEVIGKNGKPRATTVRDMRENGLRVSVTTVLKQADKPELVNWFKRNVAKAAFLNPPQPGEGEEQYTARILPLAEEVSAKARDLGTTIHAAIENNDTAGPYADWVLSANKAVNEWAPGAEWTSERSFASSLGYGGKIDLSSSVGAGHIADWKTTDKPLADLKTWPDHRRQLAAYRMGLNMPEARCAIVYVSSVVPEARLIELTTEELEQGWQEFQALLKFYYAANRLELPK